LELAIVVIAGLFVRIFCWDFLKASFEPRGMPSVLASGNGREFARNAILVWADPTHIK
jgi:hypothetical protein